MVSQGRPLTGISVGAQLAAPEGYDNMVAGDIYYFLRSNPVSGRVLLLQLVEREAKAVVYKSAKRPNRKVTPTPLPILVALRREAFERGITKHQIVAIETASAMPPWLKELEGLDLDTVDSLRRSAVKTHVDRTDDKLANIYPLVQRFEEILDSPDPDRVINRHTRSLGRKLNETRVRL